MKMKKDMSKRYMTPKCEVVEIEMGTAILHETTSPEAPKEGEKEEGIDLCPDCDFGTDAA